MKTCYRESRKQEISYTQYKRERLYRNCLPKHITEETMVGKDRSDRKMRKKKLATTGLPYRNERVLEIERGNTRSRSVENWLWKRLWTHHKTDSRMNEFQTTNDKGQPNETWGSHDGNDEEHWLLGSATDIPEKHTHTSMLQKFYHTIYHTHWKWDSSSAIRHFSAWITLHCYKCLISGYTTLGAQNTWDSTIQ